MFLKRALLVCCILSAASAPAARAQSTDTTEAVRQAKGYALVDEALRDAQDLHSPENKMFVYCNAATILWKRDPKRARELYSQLTGLYQQVLAEMKRAGPYAGNEANVGLRQMAVNQMAQNEPEMALEFVRRTATSPNSPADLQLTGALAFQLSRSRPKEAEKLAEANLAQGDFAVVSQMVANLPSMDKDAAATLVDKTVSRIGVAATQGEEQAIYAAINLLQMDDGRSPKTKMLTDAQRRSLADSAVTLMTMYSRTVEQFDPTQQALLQKNAPTAWQQFLTVASEQKQNNGESPLMAQFHEALRKGTLDEALTILGQIPAGQRSQMVNEMMWRATSSPDPSIANKLLNEYVTDDSQKAFFQRNMGTQQVQAALQRNDISAARALLAESRLGPGERAQLEIQMAQTIVSRDEKSKAQALELMEEALQTMPEIDDMEAFNFHATAAQVLANISPQRAAEVVAGLIERSNQLMGALQQVDGFIGTRQFSHGEVRPFSGGFMEVAMNAMSALAIDTDRATALANSFQATELKARAKLLVAERIINTPAGGGSGGGVVRAGPIMFDSVEQFLPFS